MSLIQLPSSRCAACKCLRRKCSPDCILAPYFPPSNPQRFASVHKIFGASNLTKMLEQVPVHLRGTAAECIVFEAGMRMKDPVYGSAGMITQLQQQITQVHNEIIKIQGEIVRQNAQKQQLEASTAAQTVIMHLQQMQSSVNGQEFLDDGSDVRLYEFDGDLDNHLSTDFNSYKNVP